MSSIFLDTVGLIALWDNSDQWHIDSHRAYLKIIQANLVGVTTDAVLLECGNAAARRPYRQDVNELRQQLIANGNLISISQSDLDQAWKAYNRGDAAGAGIVDQISFIIMHRLGINKAFTNDQHFAAAGFETLF